MKKLPLKFRILRWSFSFLEKIFPYLAHRWAIKLFFTPMRFTEPDQEMKLKESGNPFIIKYGRKKIKGYSWGEGPVVLLAHGWSGRGAQFRKFIKPVTENGFKAVIFDGPAHGESGGKRTDILEFSHILRLLESRFNGIYAIVNHSFGGAASLYAINNGLKTEKLVLIGTPTIGDDIIREFLIRINASNKTGAYFKKYIKDKFNKDFDDYEALKTSESCLNLPILVIHDLDDKEVPIYHAEKLMDKLQNAKLIKTKGLGHRRILKDDKVIEETIRFLNKKPNSDNITSKSKNSYTLFLESDTGKYFLL